MTKHMAGQRHFVELPPLALYIHIPWCVAKCPYCDFNSHEQRGPVPETQYIESLLSDLALEMPDVWGRSISSIFIGGGTPSLFSAEGIDKLLSGVRALTAISPHIEITMEANPGTFEQKKFNDFRRAGINRLSIGIQSFNQQHLEALGRIHGREESLAATDIARQAGFENINLDLMFGLPEQSFEQALDDLRQAIAIHPEHISHYQLTLEPNTLFHKYPPSLPTDDRLWEMQEGAAELLGNAGYQRYEVSAWCQPGRRSTHNLNYWQFGDYIGIGAGAHGKISSANNMSIVRISKQRHPARYLDLAATPKRIAHRETVALHDTCLEFMMNALRLVDGFSPALFYANTGVDLYTWQPLIDRAVEDGLLQRDISVISPTPKGLNFLNDLLERFMPDHDEQKISAEKLTLNYPIIKIAPETAGSSNTDAADTESRTPEP